MSALQFAPKSSRELELIKNYLFSDRKLKRQKLNNHHSENLHPINKSCVEPISEKRIVTESELLPVCNQKENACVSSLEISQLGPLLKEPIAVESSSLSSDSEDFFLGRRKLYKCFGEDLSSKLSDELILIIFRWLPKNTLVRCAFVCKRWRQIAYDESLWTRLDLSSRVLKKGSLGYVLERGTTALRLAQAEVNEPVFTSTCPMVEEGIFNKLLYLDLSMAVISGEDLAELLGTSRSLVKLSLEHCSVVGESCEAIGRNPFLEVLNMSMCYGLDDTSISNILSGCKKLSELNLAWTNLDSSALDILCTDAPKTLKRLNISGCRKSLTDNHVQKLVLSSPNLIELDLSDCTTLTSLSVEYLCNLKRLEHIALSRCYSVSSSSYLLLSNISSLLYLDVIGLFPDKSLTQLEQNLPNVSINKFLFSSISRPTVGVRRTSIWGLKVRR